MEEHKAKGMDIYVFLDVMLLHIFPRIRGTNLMPKLGKAYSLDMEKKLKDIDSMILQKAESFTVKMSGSIKQG